MMSLMCSGCREFSGGRGGKGRGADAGEAGRESTEAERKHETWQDLEKLASVAVFLTRSYPLS